MVKNSSLRIAREQRGWSQARLAELLGTSSISVSRWERGAVQPSPYFREKLYSLFDKDAENLGLLTETEVSSQPQMETPYLLDPLLPSQVLSSTGLIGREDLLLSLTQQLHAESHPSTLTLYGLPGVGKTTLLLALTQIPEIQSQFSDGILWAGLGPHPHLFEHLSRWGNLLQISQEELKNLPDRTSLAKALRSQIGSRRLLLVIDDIWHMEDALALQVGGVNCTHLLTTRFPNLATGLSMKHSFHVSELEAREGKALLSRFLPHLAKQEPTTIEQLVQEVGMLPLALTLIGKHLYPYDYLKQPRRLQTAVQQLRDHSAWLHVSQPQSFVEHHPSIPPEQPISLEAVITVSVQQLSVRAQQALHYLAMLPAKPNSFSQELVSALTPGNEEVLNNLLDAGLVENYGADRYTLHQTIADYASNMQSEVEDEMEDAKMRLVTYAISWLEKHTEDYQQVELEHTNLVTALEIATQQNQQDIPVRLGLSLMSFWLVRGWYSEAIRFLEGMLPLTRKLQDRTAEMHILQYLGEVAERHSNNEQARAYYQEGMRLAQQSQVPAERIPFLKGLGMIEIRYGNYDQAEAYCREGVELATEVQDLKQLSMLLNSLGIALFYKDHFAESKAYYLEALSLAQQTGQQELIIRVYNNLGATASLEGLDAEAEEYYQQGMKLAQKMGHQEYSIRLLNGLGVTSGQRGDETQSYVYYQQALTLARQTSYRSLMCNILYNLAEASQVLGKWDQAHDCYQESLELSREIGFRRFIASNLVGLGEVALHNHHYEQAEVFFRETLDAVLTNDFSAHSQALYGLSRIEAARERTQKALEYGRESIKIHEQIPHRKTDDVPHWVEKLESLLTEHTQTQQ